MRTLIRSLVVGGVSLVGLGNPGWVAAQAPAPGNAAVAPAQLAWLDNLDAALAQAAAERKLVLVHFWNDNCPPCVGVERNVLSRPDVQQAIGSQFVPVKIKVDDQPQLAQRFRVDRWPTDLILSANGQELYRTVSSQNAQQYLAVLTRVSESTRAALSATQEVARSANSWSERMATMVPGGRAAPATGANANFQAQAGQPTGDTAARSSFQASLPERSPFPAPPSAAPQAQPNTATPPSFERLGTSPRAANAPLAGGAPPVGALPAGPGAAPVAPGLPPSASPPAGPTAGAAPLGLEGFCPVTLQETRRWRRGDARWGVIHRDRTYLFAGPEEQRRFLENPDRFAPMLSGYDPVRYLEQGQLVDGRRQHGVWFHQQMFLFADEASLERFWKSPEAFIPRVEQAMRAASGDNSVRR
ncbi:MAG: thioredoxin family protein [Pirellulales bacterium]